MACDIDDREGESPSPVEPRLGRMSRSSATGRRRERIFPEALGLRQALHPRDDTAGSAGSEARTTRSAAARRTSIANPARMRDPNRSDRIRGDGRPSPERAPTQDPQAPPTAGTQAHRMMASTRPSGDAYSGDRRCYSRSWAYLRVHRLATVQTIMTHIVRLAPGTRSQHVRRRGQRR